MGKNNKQRFLIDNGNQKFRMHKSGKQWLFNRITALTLALGIAGIGLMSESNNNNVNADDKSSTNISEQNIKPEKNGSDSQKVTLNNNLHTQSIQSSSQEQLQNIKDDNQNKNNPGKVQDPTVNDNQSNNPSDNSTNNPSKVQDPSVNKNQNNNPSDNSTNNPSKVQDPSVNKNQNNNPSDNSTNNPSKMQDPSVNKNQNNNPSDNSTNNPSKVQDPSVNKNQSNNPSDNSTNNPSKVQDPSVNKNQSNNPSDNSTNNPSKVQDPTINKNQDNNPSDDIKEKSNNNIKTDSLDVSDVNNQFKNNKLSDTNKVINGTDATQSTNGKYSSFIKVPYKIKDDKLVQNPNSADDYQHLSPTIKFYGDANTSYVQDTSNAAVSDYLTKYGGIPYGSKLNGSFTISFDSSGKGTISSNNISGATPKYLSTTVSVPVIYNDENGNITNNTNVNFPISGYESDKPTSINLDYQTVIKASNGVIAPYYRTNSMDVNQSVIIDNNGAHLQDSSFVYQMDSGSYQTQQVNIPISIRDLNPNHPNNYTKIIQGSATGYANQTQIKVNADLNQIINDLKLPGKSTWDPDKQLSYANPGFAYVSFDNNGNVLNKNNPSNPINALIDNGNNDSFSNKKDDYKGFDNFYVVTPNYFSNCPVSYTVNDHGSSWDVSGDVSGYDGDTSTFTPNIQNISLTQRGTAMYYVSNTLPNNAKINDNSISAYINDQGQAEVDGGDPITFPNYVTKTVEVPVQVFDNNPNNKSYISKNYAVNVSGYVGNDAPINTNEFNQSDIIKFIKLSDGEDLPVQTVSQFNGDNNDNTRVNIDNDGNTKVADGQNTPIIEQTPAYTKVNVNLPITVNDLSDKNNYTSPENYSTNVTGYVGNSYSPNLNNHDDIVKALNLPKGSTVVVTKDAVTINNTNNDNSSYSLDANNSVVATTPKYVSTNVPIKINIYNAIDDPKHPGEIIKTIPQYYANAEGYVGNQYNLNNNWGSNNMDRSSIIMWLINKGYLKDEYQSASMYNNDKYEITFQDNSGQSTTLPYALNGVDGKTAPESVNVYLPSKEKDVSVNIPVTIASSTDGKSNSNITEYYNYDGTISGITGNPISLDPTKMTNTQIISQLNKNYPNMFLPDNTKIRGNDNKLSAVIKLDENGKPYADIVKGTTLNYTDASIEATVPNYETNEQVNIPVVVHDDKHNGETTKDSSDYSIYISGYDGETPDYINGQPFTQSQPINANTVLLPDRQTILSNVTSGKDISSSSGNNLPIGTTFSGSIKNIIVGKSTATGEIDAYTPKYENDRKVQFNINVHDANGNIFQKQYNALISGYDGNNADQVITPNKNDDQIRQWNLPISYVTGNASYYIGKDGTPDLTNPGQVDAYYEQIIQNNANINVSVNDTTGKHLYEITYNTNVQGYANNNVNVNVVKPGSNVENSDTKDNINENDIINYLRDKNKDLPPKGISVSGNAVVTMGQENNGETVNTNGEFIATIPQKVTVNADITVNITNADNALKPGTKTQRIYHSQVTGYVGNDAEPLTPNDDDIIKQFNDDGADLPIDPAKSSITTGNNGSAVFTIINNTDPAKQDSSNVALNVPDWVDGFYSASIVKNVNNQRVGILQPYTVEIAGYTGSKVNITPSSGDIINKFNLPDNTSVTGQITGQITSATDYPCHSTLSVNIPKFGSNEVSIPVNIHNDNNGKDSTENYNTTINGYNGSTEELTPDPGDVIKQLNLPQNTNVSGSVNVKINTDTNKGTTQGSINALIPSNNKPDNNNSGNNDSNNNKPDNNNSGNNGSNNNEPDIMPNGGRSGNAINTSTDNNGNNNISVNNNDNANNSEYQQNNNNNYGINNHSLNDKAFTDIYLNVKKPLIKINVPIKLITKGNKVIKYSPKGHPIFRLLSIRKLNHGKAIFKVSMRGTKGTFVAKMKNVPLAYYTAKDLKKHYANYVVSIDGDFSHSNKDFRQHRNNGLKRGQRVKILKVVRDGEITRFKLGNGHYLTSNKYYVKLTTSKPTKYNIR